jgi:hypothetical protein
MSIGIRGIVVLSYEQITLLMQDGSFDIDGLAFKTEDEYALMPCFPSSYPKSEECYAT